MNTYEYPLNPLENASIKANAFDGLSWDYAGIYRYYLVKHGYIGVCLALAPLALPTAFSKGEA